MERIGSWSLLERIGVGGVADVWRGRNVEDGRTAALKILREPDRSAAHRDRFLREGRLLQRLALTGLPQCFEVHDGPQPFLALELLEGETLAERIRARGALGLDLVESVTVALLRVLAVLHARGIIHRDVKSSNVFLTDDGRTLLLDLGLAADPHDPLMTTLGDVMGTYAYMAPEQIAGAEVDHRCDLYSLGITLYEALAGTRPFHASDAAGFLRLHREGRPPSLADRRPEAPARLVDTITRLMSRDPAARPVSATMALALLTGTSGVQRSLARPPMVGRSAAEGAILAVLDAGGTVAVLGEVGSGTGRVANSALERARLAGFETIAIRCLRRSHPLDPLHQIARDLSQILGGPVDVSPDALAASLTDLAAEGPAFLLVEGIEQASPEAVSGLARIRRQASKLAVLYTGVELPAGLNAHIVWLRPLRIEEVERIISGMLGTHSIPAGMAEQLHRMSGGLPTLVVAAVKELYARKALRYEEVSDEGDPVWRLDRNAPLVPTIGMARMYGDLLVSLSEGSQALLEVLSVAAEALPLRVALEVAGVDPSGEALGRLLQEGLVDHEHSHEAEWVSLRRPAVGTLILGQMPEARIAELHRTLARALSRLPRDAWLDERVAWHTAFGAPPDHAARALLALGEQLHNTGQHNRALEVLSRAAHHTPTTSGISASLAIVRGEALAAVGRREEAALALRAGHELAVEMVDARLAARSLVALAELQQSLRDMGSLQLAEQALAFLADIPEDPLLPRVLLAAANAHRIGAEPEAAAARYHQCIDAAMGQGQREYAAMAHGGLGLLLAEAGRLEDAARHLEQEAAFLRVRPLPGRFITTLCRLGMVRLRLGEVRSAIDALDEADAVARLAELPHERARVQIARGTLLLEIGDRRGASARLRSARAALEPDAAGDLRLSYRLLQGEIRLQAGDHQAALATMQAAETDEAGAGFASLQAYSRGMAGVLTADTDGLDRAMSVLGRSGDRSLTARLLLHGARMTGDAELLRAAEGEARGSHDRLVLLAILYAMGTDTARAEAHEIARFIDQRLPRSLRRSFRAMPAVRWAGLVPQQAATAG